MQNPLRLDPTRTTTLRARYGAAMRARFTRLRNALVQLVAYDDAFGRIPPKPMGTLAEAGRWRFETDEKKVALFLEWLSTQINDLILEPVGDVAAIWQVEYIVAAYKKGVIRAYADVLPPAAVGGTPGFYAGSRAQFLEQAFKSPEAVSKLRLLFTRSYEQLKGITADMAGKLATILTDGLAHGTHPYDIAKRLTEEVAGISRKRAELLARTEIIHAHAEGQLDSFERLGLEEVGLRAEWVTAGDERVCPRCAAMEGQVMPIREARGLIPLHPNCLCMWVPVVVDAIRRAYRARATLFDDIAA